MKCATGLYYVDKDILFRKWQWEKILSWESMNEIEIGILIWNEVCVC